MGLEIRKVYCPPKTPEEVRFNNDFSPESYVLHPPNNLDLENGVVYVSQEGESVKLQLKEKPGRRIEVYDQHFTLLENEKEFLLSEPDMPSLIFRRVWDGLPGLGMGTRVGIMPEELEIGVQVHSPAPELKAAAPLSILSDKSGAE